MRKHDLKTWPSYFQEVWDGKKTFEVRKDDRDFAVGDDLVLSEWDPALLNMVGSFTGREIWTIVTYKLSGGQFGIQPGYCVLGFNSSAIERKHSHA